ncbi:hypothetical protein F5Y13DRAFT_162209 [Hypoxylon sp. FL1857]|nr:hypothetical protein F5Y13DRAFT_162209 [Hypoxylon sp. FL1857]
MRSLYMIRGPLCRSLSARPPHILKRYKFSGRTTAADKPRSSSLPDTPARTRFAPSPTGYVHIGSLRTALYNYLLAKATGGQFLLRIEDTDRARTVQDAEKRLYEDLRWTGLTWDEGPDVGGPYGPYKQSERLELYNKYADQLLNQGRAYRCFCTPEDLDQMRALSIQEGTPTIYNRNCSHISPDVSARRAANGEPHCVRFKSDQQPLVNDLVYGQYTRPEPQDDFIIIKQDGYPTYHFANVVDDHLMEITHVIRGAEWLVSTPRHVALYDAFGWQKPLFAHVGLLVNEDRQKLGKRHGDVDIASWRDRGILPATLLNYVMLLGWSPGKGKGVKEQQDVLGLDEMVSKFHLGFTKGDITVNSKHEFLQKAHVRRLSESFGSAGVSNIVLPAVEAHVRKYEEQRKSGSAAPDSVAAELGPLVPIAQPQAGRDGSDAIISKEYIKNVFQSDIQNYKDAEACVLRNRYLIWQIPDALYRSSLQEELANLDELRLHRHEPSTDDAASSSPLNVEKLRVSGFSATLRDLLQEIGDESWKRDAIEATILPFLKSVYATLNTGNSEPQLWGYHLLRWVIAASRSGPALIQGMTLLGKEETMTRVEKAYEVAKSVESESGAKQS